MINWLSLSNTPPLPTPPPPPHTRTHSRATVNNYPTNNRVCLLPKFYFIFVHDVSTRKLGPSSGVCPSFLIRPCWRESQCECPWKHPSRNMYPFDTKLWYHFDVSEDRRQAVKPIVAKIRKSRCCFAFCCIRRTIATRSQPYWALYPGTVVEPVLFTHLSSYFHFRHILGYMYSYTSPECYDTLRFGDKYACQLRTHPQLRDKTK